MHKLYALPLSLGELTSWYAEGVANLHAYRFVPLDERGEAPRVLRRYAARSLPGYTDDFEVLYAVVGFDRLGLQEFLSGHPLPVIVEVPFEHIERVYASTERGGNMLPSRLPPGIAVEGVLFGEDGTYEDTYRAQRKTRRGGEALLTVTDLGSYRESICEGETEIWRALELRDQQVGFPIEGGTFVDNLLNYDRNLLAYDRRVKIPRSLLGYAYDYGAVAFSYTPSPSSQLVDALKSMRNQLDDLRDRGETDVWSNYDVLRPHFERLAGLTDRRYAPAACIAFLEVQEHVRASGQLGDSHDGIVRPMTSLGLEKELALGLYLVGSFFGFATFAEEYYSMAKGRLRERWRDDRDEREWTGGELVEQRGGATESPRADQAVAPDLFDKGGLERKEEDAEFGQRHEDAGEGSGNIPIDALAPRDVDGSGKHALMEEDLGSLSHMLVASVSRDGEDGRLPREEAEKVVAGVFGTKRYDEVKQRLKEALDLAYDENMLIIDGDDLMLKESPQ